MESSAAGHPLHRSADFGVVVGRLLVRPLLSLAAMESMEPIPAASRYDRARDQWVVRLLMVPISWGGLNQKQRSLSRSQDEFGPDCCHNLAWSTSGGCTVCRDSDQMGSLDTVHYFEESGWKLESLGNAPHLADCHDHVGFVLVFQHRKMRHPLWTNVTMRGIHRAQASSWKSGDVLLEAESQTLRGTPLLAKVVAVQHSSNEPKAAVGLLQGEALGSRGDND